MNYDPIVRDVPSELQSDLSTVLRRVAAVGGTDDELGDLEAAWDEYTHEERRALLVMPKGELRRALLDVRADNDFHSLTAEEAAAREAEAEAKRLAAQAALVVEDNNVPEVLAWVGDDPARARAALDAENAAGSPRVTLTTRLAEVAQTE